MEYVIVKGKSGQTTNLDDLQHQSKEDLIKKIQALEAHNNQLKNIISKSTQDKQKPVSKKGNKSFDFTKCKFRHVLLKFLYLGYDYQGYVTQEDTTNTVEHHLFEALIKTCLIKDRASSNYHRCGRTDKGVTSFGQVVSLNLRSKLPDNITDEINYCYVLNRVLPENIQCISWCPVNSNFSARFDCKSRTYKYYFPKEALEIEKMKTAAQHLIGTHDFRNFCKMDVGNGVVKFIRKITDFNIKKFKTAQCEERDIYVALIKGQAFLWHQIRCIMGVLFLIGDGKEDTQIIKELLDVEVNPRKPDYNMASEIPLNLYNCEYDIDDSQWVYDHASLKLVINKLKSTWTLISAKEASIENMLHDLENLERSRYDSSKDESRNSLYLLNGAKSQKYIPLMQKQKCDSLESKISHFVKRKRIESKV